MVRRGDWRRLFVRSWPRPRPSPMSFFDTEWYWHWTGQLWSDPYRTIYGGREAGSSRAVARCTIYIITSAATTNNNNNNYYYNDLYVHDMYSSRCTITRIIIIMRSIHTVCTGGDSTSGIYRFPANVDRLNYALYAPVVVSRACSVRSHSKKYTTYGTISVHS